MIGPELAAMVEANAWTYGPTDTALRVLHLTRERAQPPGELWEELLAACPRMAPLGYWRAAVERGGVALEALEPDYLQREAHLVRNLHHALGAHAHVLVVGHDREMERWWALPQPPGRAWRHLLLSGPPGAEPPGARIHRRRRRDDTRVEPPFEFERIEEALEWADAVVLTGFVVHRQNLLGPAQLRAVLASARDHVEAVVLATTHERRLALGEGAPRAYRDDFRPHLWQSSVTHLVSEWSGGAGGTALGWLPLPPEVLRAQLGEVLTGPADADGRAGPAPEPTPAPPDKLAG